MRHCVENPMDELAILLIGKTLQMNQPVVSRYFLKFDTDTEWCHDASISIPFYLAALMQTQLSWVPNK